MVSGLARVGIPMVLAGGHADLGTLVDLDRHLLDRLDVLKRHRHLFGCEDRGDCRRARRTRFDQCVLYLEGGTVAAHGVERKPLVRHVGAPARRALKGQIRTYHPLARQ